MKLNIKENVKTTKKKEGGKHFRSNSQDYKNVEIQINLKPNMNIETKNQTTNIALTSNTEQINIENFEEINLRKKTKNVK